MIRVSGETLDLFLDLSPERWAKLMTGINVLFPEKLVKEEDNAYGYLSYDPETLKNTQSLHHYLLSNPSYEEALKAALGIIDGVTFLHSHKIVVNHLTRENVVVKGGVTAIADFIRATKANNGSWALKPRGDDITSDILKVFALLHQILEGHQTVYGIVKYNILYFSCDPREAREKLRSIRDFLIEEIQRS
jgi:hypothetical protein